MKLTLRFMSGILRGMVPVEEVGRRGPLLRVVLTDSAHGRPGLGIVAKVSAQGIVRVGGGGSLLRRGRDGCREGI